MAFVDTTIVLRWLLGDHATLSPKAERLVATAKPGTLVVTDIVTTEVVYILRGTGRDRRQTVEALLLLERTEAYSYEHPDLTSDIIRLLTATHLDFADCYLLARARHEHSKLETFDEALRKAYLAAEA